jgi:chemotaxis protein methyltransferase CheR
MQNNTVIESLSIPHKDFLRLGVLIHNVSGIKISDPKKTMLESRLQRRLKRLGMQSFREYLNYLFSPEGMQNELVYMIDEVTTNKTDFFREPAHFEFLVHHALPEMVKAHSGEIHKRLTLWSAGCSSGEEPYTLAMVLSEFAVQSHCPGLSFLILATDISKSMLEKAALAIYDEERIAPVPVELQRKYLLKSKSNVQLLYRVVPELRRLVKLRMLNFMDSDFGFREPIDSIFCRNVIIYFDKKTQEELLRKFCNCLASGGYIFMGHSETLFGMDLPLVQVAPTIYRKTT